MMKYPNITIEISNNTAVLLLNKSATSKSIIKNINLDLKVTFATLYKLLDIKIGSNWQIVEVEELALKGDPSEIREALHDKLQGQDFLEFTRRFVTKAIKIQKIPHLDELSEKVKRQLIEFKNWDIIATFVDKLYESIAQIIIDQAKENQIFAINLLDYVGLPRLREKLSSELAKMEISLTIID